MEPAPPERVIDSRGDFIQVLATGGAAAVFGLILLRVINSETFSLEGVLVLLLLQTVLGLSAMLMAISRRGRLGIWGIVFGVVFGVVGLGSVGYLGLLALMFHAGARVGG